MSSEQIEFAINTSCTAVTPANEELHFFFVLYGWCFKVPFAWLALTELSTPFLNARWFLAVLERKEESLYFYASLAFALSFLATRTVGYSLGMVHLWMQRALWLPASRGLYWTVAGCHAGWALNLYWTLPVASALLRAATGSSSAARKAD